MSAAGAVSGASSLNAGEEPPLNPPLSGRPPFTAEQSAAVADRSGSRLLAANAGSGKTAVMVERFVEAVLADGVGVENVLALTFTEKAAAELRERVRRRFADAGAHEQARQAEGAWIGTIHGFCARLLRAHPFGAGLDPRVGVLDEPAARRLAWTAFESALEAWARERGEEAVDFVASYSYSLRDVVLAAYAELRSRGQAAPRLPAVALRPEPVAERAALQAAAVVAAAALAREQGGTRVDAGRAALQACLEALELPGVHTPAALDPARLRNGSKALDSEQCAGYRTAYDAYRQACADYHAARAIGHVDSLLEAFSAAYAAAKSARAAVDFEDLQLATRDLLAADASLRERWAERFELIMVDEFQDTNRLQLAILEMLERGNLFAVGDEFQSIYGFRHADVGIFRERAATLGPDRTRRLRTNFRSREELLDVLNGAFGDHFGAAFEPLVAGRTAPRADVPVADGELRLFDPDHVSAAPTTPGASAPPVELLLTERDGWEEVEGELGAAAPGEAAWRRAEARLIAGRLRWEVDSGRKPGDIVVLVRAVASLRGLEQALEDAGLPTYVVGGRGYWSQEQVRDGIAYLSVLANPLDETALYHVLASPFGRASADALFLLSRAASEHGGLWAALHASDRPDLRPLVALLDRERAMAERLPVEVLLERGIAETGYDLATLSRAGGERRLANLRKLMRLAREYERAEGRDLRGFLAYAVTQDLTEAREGEAALDSEGLDAVRLMTIHRAKGLEFPVVCVADLGRQAPGSRPTLLLGADGRAGLRLRTLGGGRSVAALDWDALWAERQAAEAAEERRLFYVAMTRAQDTLILSGGVDLARWPQPRPSGPPIDWIARALLGADPAGALSATAGLDTGAGTTLDRPWQGRPARLRVAVSRPADVAALALPARPRGERAPGTALPAVAPAVEPVAPAPRVGPAVAGIPRRLSYSSLGDYGRCSYRFYLERVLGLRPVKAPPAALAPDVAPTEVALDPLVRGSLVHVLLEHADLASGEPPSAAAIEELAATHGVTLTEPDVADIAQLVSAFLQSQLARRLRSATAVRREAPFAFPLEPGPAAPLVHGFVDLLAREPDGTVLVVDYKTDRLDGADPEQLVSRDYAAQRLVYALAALREGAMRVEVAHCFLERADEPAVASYGAPDAPALAEDLVRKASGLLRAEFVPTATPHRELCGTCPGRRALCSWPQERTLAPQTSAGCFSGSGGPS